jgi:hypothetical protein
MSFERNKPDEGALKISHGQSESARQSLRTWSSAILIIEKALHCIQEQTTLIEELRG